MRSAYLHYTICPYVEELGVLHAQVSLENRSHHSCISISTRNPKAQVFGYVSPASISFLLPPQDISFSMRVNSPIASFRQRYHSLKHVFSSREAFSNFIHVEPMLGSDGKPNEWINEGTYLLKGFD